MMEFAAKTPTIPIPFNKLLKVVALVDGDRRQHARTLGKSIRDNGFRTPLWALADSSRIADLSVLGMVGEVDGFIYLGQQTPAFYAKQVCASITSYGMSLLPPFFGALMACDSEARISFACPGHQGGTARREHPGPHRRDAGTHLSTRHRRCRSRRAPGCPGAPRD